MKMKTNMTMMTMTRGSGQNQGWSTFPSIDGPPACLGTHHTLMTRMTMAKWRWQNDSDNKKWPWFNQILFTIMETFIHDSGNSDVHSKDGNVLLSNNLLHIFFCNYCILYLLFFLYFVSTKLCLCWNAAGREMPSVRKLLQSLPPTWHLQPNTPSVTTIFSNYLQPLGRYGPKRCALLNLWWLMMMADVVNILTMLIMNKIFFFSGCSRFTQYKMDDYEMLANLKMTKTFFQVMCVAQYKTRGGQASETTSKAPSSSASPTPR